MHRPLYSILAITLALSPLPSHSQVKSANELIRQLNDAYIAVFDKVAPSVVVIEIEKPVERRNLSLPGLVLPLEEDEEKLSFPPELSEGSGIICRPDGYIYTNNHVVEGGGKITVKLKDGRSFVAKVVGKDPFSDVAVIKVDATDLPAAEFANSDQVRIGQLAFVIGSPFNFTYSFTSGVISGKGRNKIIEANEKWGGQFEDFLQTDASINPGNSGGPLLDIDGRVVGMNTIIQDVNRGLGFAVSSNMLKRVGDELIEKGRVMRPYIGIAIRSIKEVAGQKAYGTLKSGVIVKSFRDDTPAFRSGLQPEDVIVKVDDQVVDEASDLQREVQKKKVGQTLQLAVWRKGKELTIPVVTGEMPQDSASLTAGPMNPSEPEAEETPGASEDKHSDSAASGNLTFGMEVQTLTPELAEAQKTKAAAGVIVTQIMPGSESATAGVEVGDIITEVNGAAVTNEKAFAEALSKADRKKGVLLFVERVTGSAYLVLKVSP